MNNKRVKNVWRCCLALLLTIVISLGCIIQGPALALENDDTLCYELTSYYELKSPHLIPVHDPVEGNVDMTAEISVIQRGYYYYPVYCDDLAIGTEEDSLYQMLNLEDVEYYSADDANALRTIMINGYWLHTDNYYAADYWTQEEVDALGDAAGIKLTYDEEGNVIDNGELRSGEALAATQMAIWNYANSDKENMYFTGVYNGSKQPWEEGDERNETDYEWYFGDEIDPEVNQYTERHMIAVRDYLINLAESNPTPATPGQVIFSDKFNTEWTYISYKENDGKYEATLHFAMVGDPLNYSGLYLNATYGNKILLDHMSLSNPTDPLSYDRDKNEFTLTFVTDDLSDTIEMELTGNQWIDPGVYLFMSANKGYSSQNFITKLDYSDVTPINATFEIPSAGIDIELTKVNESGNALPDCEFELWAEKDGMEFLIGTYTTDSNGKIVINDIKDASWNYYFKEISAPDGYDINTDKQKVPKNGKIRIVNNFDSGILTVKKEVKGVPTTQKFAFTIQLDLKSCMKDAVDHLIKAFTPNEKVTSWSAGTDKMTINIALKDGETYELAGIPAGANYTVTELDGDNLMYAGGAEYAEGMCYTPDKSDASGVIDDDANVTFVNTLNAGKTTLTGKKYLDNKDNPSPVGFTFRLEQIDGPIKQAGFPKEVVNDSNGVFCFDGLGYNVEGTYVYKLTEVPDTHGNKYDYDDTVYYVTIEVTKDNDEFKVSDPVVSIRTEATDPDANDTIVTYTPVEGNLAEFINITNEVEDNNTPSNPSDDDNTTTKPSNDDNTTSGPLDESDTSSTSSENDDALSKPLDGDNMSGADMDSTPYTGDNPSLLAPGIAAIVSAVGLVWIGTAIKKREDQV